MGYAFVHMTFFKMLRPKPFLWVLIAAAYVPGTLWACEAILKSSPHQINPARLNLPRRENLVRDIAAAALIFPVRTNQDDFWTMVFDPRPDQKNEGHLISGKVRGGIYYGTRVRHTHAETEKDYFKAIARLHDLHDQTLVLNRKHARCETIHVNAWIEAKLLLKHGLKIQEVKRLLEAPETVRVYDDGYRDRRYRIQAHDQFGQSIAIVIAEKDDCPHVLVTAYAEAEQTAQ